MEIKGNSGDKRKKLELQKTNTKIEGAPVSILSNSEEQITPEFKQDVKEGLNKLAGYGPRMKEIIKDTNFMLSPTKKLADTTLGANYDTFKNRITLSEKSLEGAAKSNMFMTQKTPFTKESLNHEFGHKFDDSKTFTGEEDIKKEMIELDKKVKVAMREYHQAKAACKKQETYELRTDMDKKRKKYISLLKEFNSLSDKRVKNGGFYSSSSKEFKDAYKKDLENLHELYKQGKTSGDMSKYENEASAVSYFTQGAKITDGIDETDMKESIKGQSEVFAEGFAYTMENKSSKRINIFAKHFPNSIKAVKGIMQNVLGQRVVE